ncbi:MAG TPA: hypothetical protein VF100_08910, partial [Thermoanaerobaculia bacterium]
MRSSVRPLLVSLVALAAPPLAAETPWTLDRLDLEVELRPEEGIARVRGRSTLRHAGDRPDAGPVLGVNADERVVRFLEVEAIYPRSPHAPIEPRNLEGTESEVAAVR